MAVPSPEQCIAIVSFANRAYADVFNAALALLYGCGAQGVEVLGVKRGHITMSERMRVHIVGPQERTVPVPNGVAQRLLRITDDCSAGSSEEFVFSRAGKQLTHDALRWELKQRSRLLGMRRPLVETDLRLAFVAHMTDRQMPIEVISTMMGLTNVNNIDRMLIRALS